MKSKPETKKMLRLSSVELVEQVGLGAWSVGFSVEDSKFGMCDCRNLCPSEVRRPSKSPAAESGHP